MSGKRQSYNETFKREAVRYVQEQTKSLPQIAEELNVNLDTSAVGWEVPRVRKRAHQPCGDKVTTLYKERRDAWNQWELLHRTTVSRSLFK